MTFSDFFDALGDFDYLAIIVGTLAIMVLGWLWYGPFFGKAWSAASGQPMMSGMPATPKLVATAIYSFVFNVGLAYTTVGPDDIEHALVAAGLVIGVLLIGSMMYAGVVWGSYNPNAFYIDLLFVFVAAALATWVQSLIIG